MSYTSPTANNSSLNTLLPLMDRNGRRYSKPQSESIPYVLILIPFEHSYRRNPQRPPEMKGLLLRTSLFIVSQWLRLEIMLPLQYARKDLHFVGLKTGHLHQIEVVLVKVKALPETIRFKTSANEYLQLDDSQQWLSGK